MPRPPHRLPPLNALRAFTVAARHLSFSKAAAEMFVTPAAVSQQVKLLEDHLGIALFRRTPRALLLTDAGQACLPGLQEAFERMGTALDEIAAAGQRGALTVSVAPSFAGKWLLPRLDRFGAQNPGVDVRVSATMHLTDFDAEGVDVAIRYGLGAYPDLHVQKLLSESVFPVCSPEMLANHKIETPADLATLPLIHDDSPDRDPSCPDWRMWLRAAGVTHPDAERGLQLNQSSLVLESAIAGRGVALAKARLAQEDLRAGRLVKPFDLEKPVEFAYWFVCPPSRLALQKVELFRDWLMAEAADET